VEAIYAATAQWNPQDSELAVLTDGMHHVPRGGISFYGPRGVPTAADWTADLRRTGLLPDLRGLRVYHLGLGLPEAGGPPSYPHAHQLKALWQAYWDASNAQVSFGAPLYVQGLGG